MRKLIISLAGLVLVGAFISSCNKKEDEPEKVELKAPVISAVMDGETVEVSWKAVTNATSYTVECKKATDSDFTVAATVTHSPAAINALDFGNTYQFRVKATCGDSESPYSNVVSLMVAKYLPKPVVAVNAGVTFIEVEWEAVEGATTYQLEHKLTLDSDYTVDYTGDGADILNKYKIEGLESGISYDIRVGAAAEGFSMCYSDVTTIATTEAPSVIISTAAQLAEWLESIDSETDYVATLANDIDMSEKTITSAAGFSGTFDGQGFAIKNLVSSVPLFAENGGRIKNLSLDESCVFTPASNVFGALVALDKGGNYSSICSAASITYKATADITENLAIGGLVGASDSEGGSFFNTCSNSGPVTIDAEGYTHWAVAMGGIVGWTRKSTFESCTNSAPITLKALYGDPLHQWSYVSDATADLDGNISIAGIVGKAFDLDTGDIFKSSFNRCENLEGGDITLIHNHMDALVNNDANHGCLNVAGICGEGNGTMENCHNRAPVTAVAICPANNDYWKRKNCLLKVGGLVGISYEGIEINSCSNRAAISVNYDGSYDTSLRNISAVGGIIGRQGYGKVDAKVYFSTNHGPITVTGNGHVAVGGICGAQGYQRGNRVYDTATINVSCKSGMVGGLLGFADGGSQYQHIRTSYCEADITAENTWDTNRYVLSVGGLVGCFGIGKTDSYPSFVPYSPDPQRCHYTGNIVSKGQMKVGMVIGWISNNSEKVFGDPSTPILVQGTIHRWGYDRDNEMETPLTIDASNVEDYAIGSAGDAAVTIYVTAN
ncbi:MAG: fibronectin type III domain-containing protein [Bacteroidales bacterium]|nr:fibronectin type III domain-containing protein [Bacteroidales bacterium]